MPSFLAYSKLRSRSMRCCSFRRQNGMRALRIRFYVDPSTGAPHILNHQVSEDEVADVLDGPGEDRARGEGFRILYLPDPETDSGFAQTAYDWTGAPLAAYSKRRKKKVQ
jgi:hypothetical protein